MNMTTYIRSIISEMFKYNASEDDEQCKRDISRIMSNYGIKFKEREQIDPDDELLSAWGVEGHFFDAINSFAADDFLYFKMICENYMDFSELYRKNNLHATEPLPSN